MFLHITLATLVACASTVSEGFSVTVYYESLCPDSRNFILKQLTPTYVQLSEYFDVDWVPYGLASHSSDPWSITCPHGPNECYANMFQACVLARTLDKVKQVEFVICMMIDPKNTEECAEHIGLFFEEIEMCTEGWEGEQLMAMHGNRTNNFPFPISKVPMIAIRDKFDQEIQNASLKRFTTVICDALSNPIPWVCGVKKAPF